MILKFEYYGTPFNVKKIQKGDFFIISVYNFKASYIYQTFFENCLIKGGLKVSLAETGSKDSIIF